MSFLVLIFFSFSSMMHAMFWLEVLRRRFERACFCCVLCFSTPCFIMRAFWTWACVSTHGSIDVCRYVRIYNAYHCIFLCFFTGKLSTRPTIEGKKNAMALPDEDVGGSVRMIPHMFFQ